MRKTWNEFNISSFWNKNDYYFSKWIDYLSLSLNNFWQIQPFVWTRIKSLDYDNSNYWIIQICDELLTANKTKSPNWDAYIYSISYNWVSIPIFNINIHNKYTYDLTNSYWVIHFYWSYYRLIELDYFSQYFLDYIYNNFKDNLISRIDYRFDFLYKKDVKFQTKEQLFPNLRKNRFSRFYQTSDSIQSFDIWKKAYKNVFIRFYNKLIELDWNLKKLYLYWDILTKEIKSFHRLEYEFWIKFTHWYKLKDIEELKNKIYNYTWYKKNTNFINYYKPQVVIDLSDEIHKLRYIKVFTTMYKNLKNNWVDIEKLLKTLDNN